ncbi:hypothetical protein RKE30_35915 [Streptomyces sp. Li-HN-5-11]|uniref:hypothetical protein n=1 Tax=Streptomyces sp. Li-HN-5-11 TaxID=3075432 RepID=UPI0028A63D42|nr:hypothetical protein [Streptomyces sp. Li-HN-5-11]WNM35370.1 hypothetical protein RKE30_35915 [Streptomyces sp. Li-HN-5-11]
MLADLMPSSNAILNSVLVGLTPLALHCLYVARRLRRAAPPTAPELAALTGITSCFTSDNVEELRRCLREDMARVRRVRVVSPDPSALFADTSVIGPVLREAAAQGVAFELVGSERVQSPSDIGLSSRHRVVGSGQLSYPMEWQIVVAGSTVYFGYGSTALQNSNQVFHRAVTSVDSSMPHVRRLADVILATAEEAFSWAHQPEAAAKVFTTSSPGAYRSRIVPAEAGAAVVDRIPKRLSVMFKGEATVRSIAQQRFGDGSPSVAEYVEEHEARRREFFGALARGMRCREIYNQAELISYVTSRRHSRSVLLASGEMRDTVERWRQAIAMYDNYKVAITTDPLPFKYELVDGKLVVMHEAIGVGDLQRLNAIFVQSARIGRDFSADFEIIWERSPPDRRSRAGLLRFIDEELIPLVS